MLQTEKKITWTIISLREEMPTIILQIIGIKFFIIKCQLWESYRQIRYLIKIILCYRTIQRIHKWKLILENFMRRLLIKWDFKMKDFKTLWGKWCSNMTLVTNLKHIWMTSKMTFWTRFMINIWLLKATSRVLKTTCLKESITFTITTQTHLEQIFDNIFNSISLI